MGGMNAFVPVSAITKSISPARLQPGPENLPYNRKDAHSEKNERPCSLLRFIFLIKILLIILLPLPYRQRITLTIFFRNSRRIRKFYTIFSFFISDFWGAASPLRVRNIRLQRFLRPMGFPSQHPLFHPRDIQHAQGEAFPHQFLRQVFIVLFKDRVFLG